MFWPWNASDCSSYTAVRLGSLLSLSLTLLCPSLLGISPNAACSSNCSRAATKPSSPKRRDAPRQLIWLSKVYPALGFLMCIHSFVIGHAVLPRFDGRF